MWLVNFQAEDRFDVARGSMGLCVATRFPAAMT